MAKLFTNRVLSWLSLGVLLLHAGAAAAPFTVTHNCPSSLPPAGQCQISVVFTPPAVTSYNSSFDVVTDAAGSPHTVSLSGIGTLPAQSVLLNIDEEQGTIANPGSINSTLNNVGVAITEATVAQGSFSLEFNPRGDYLRTPVRVNNWFGTADFTMEAWVRPDTVAASAPRHALFSNYPPGLYGPDRWILALSNTVSGQLEFYAYNPNPYGPLLVAPTLLPANQWTHVAVTRQGNTFRLFVNGTLQATATSAAALDDPYGPSPQVVGVGLADGGGNNWGFVGKMDAVRVYRGYAKYTGNFTS